MKSSFLSGLLMAAGLALVAWATVAPARAQEVKKDTLEGVTNYVHIETTVACTGAVKPESVPKIKEIGYASIFNLRRAEEDGANVEAEAAAAKAAGIRYYWIPFNGTSPDNASVDKFLDDITQPGAEPAFIHCGSGNRAAAMWMAKRMVVDHWDVDRAGQEAAELGLTSGPLKQFMIEYAQTHKR